MKLSQFITETMYEISLGIDDARKRCKELAAINPSSVDGAIVEERSYVDFDAEIVVEDETHSQRGSEADGRARISIVSVATAGGGVKSSEIDTQSNAKRKSHRVSFKVPVHFAANYKNNPHFEV